MTREEEINKFINKFLTDLHGLKHGKDREYLNDTYEASLIKVGAVWADNNPKSPWINAKEDLPYKHEKLTHSNYTDRVLVLSRHGFSDVAFMTKIGDTWEWNTPIVVLYWMPIPQLPKE